MAEWGRKQYSKAWPSRRPVWTLGAFFLSILFFAAMLTINYEGSWSAAERLYLSDYLKSGTRGQTSARSVSKYTLLEAVVDGRPCRIDREREACGRSAARF